MPKIGIFRYLAVTNKLRMQLSSHGLLNRAPGFCTIHNNLKISDHLIAYVAFSMRALSVALSLAFQNHYNFQQIKRKPSVMRRWHRLVSPSMVTLEGTLPGVSHHIAQGLFLRRCAKYPLVSPGDA